MLFEHTKVVFFDLDDTLWHFTANSRVALETTFEAFCHRMDELCRDEKGMLCKDEKGQLQTCSYETFSAVYHRHNEQLWHDYSQGVVSVDYLRSERFRATIEELTKGQEDEKEKADGQEADEGSTHGAALLSLAKEMDTYYLDTLAALPRLITGARHLLDYLSAKGYALGILSNGFSGTQQKKLASSGISGYFQYIVLSEECGCQKPQRGIFDTALRRAGCEAREVVMIGDNPDTDIRGAHEAGWPTIYFDWKGLAAIACGADADVHTLAEIEDIL